MNPTVDTLARYAAALGKRVAFAVVPAVVEGHDRGTSITGWSGGVLITPLGDISPSDATRTPASGQSDPRARPAEPAAEPKRKAGSR